MMSYNKGDISVSDQSQIADGLVAELDRRCNGLQLLSISLKLLLQDWSGPPARSTWERICA